MAGKASPEARVKAVLDYVELNVHDSVKPGLPAWKEGLVFAYYRWTPFRADTRSILEFGTDYRGPCGSKTRVTRDLLRSVGFDTRRMLLHDKRGTSLHTVALVKLPYGWVPVDPAFNLAFHKGGRLATLQEVEQDAGVFTQGVTAWSQGRAGKPGPKIYPPEYTYSDVYNFNWGRAMPMRLAHDALITAAGPGAVRAVSMPDLYDRPKLVTGIFLILLALLQLGTWNLLRRGASHARS